MIRPSSPSSTVTAVSSMTIAGAGVVLMTAVTLTGSLAGCSSAPALSSHRAEPAELVVTRTALDDRVLLTGALEAADSAPLTVPRTRSWQVSIRWMADHGARVKTGDRLIEFDNSAVTEQLRELELAIVRTDNELITTRASQSVALADRELEVERQRVEVAKARIKAELPQSLLPRREWQDNQLTLERAVTAHATAIDELAAARKAAALELEVKQIELQKAEREYERATAQLDALVLKAPRDGVVVIPDHPWFGRPLQVGDMVQPGFLAAEVSNNATMKVTAQLSDVDDGRIAVGMPATSMLDAHPDKPFTGRVEVISEIAKEAGEKSTRRFFEVTVTLEQTDTEIMQPGMSIRTDILARRAENVLVAPRTGLILPSQGKDAKPRARLSDGSKPVIELDFCTPQACVVTSGLSEGDRLRGPHLDDPDDPDDLDSPDQVADSATQEEAR